MKSTCLALLAAVAFTTASAQSLPQNGITPCNSAICGGYPQNVATMAISGGDVDVTVDGHVRVTLIGLRDKATNAVLGNTILEVRLGGFANRNFAPGSAVGTLRTDSNGDFAGLVLDSSGAQLRLSDGPHAGSFVFNALNRSQFITGFVVSSGNSVCLAQCAQTLQACLKEATEVGERKLCYSRNADCKQKC